MSLFIFWLMKNTFKKEPMFIITTMTTFVLVFFPKPLWNLLNRRFLLDIIHANDWHTGYLIDYLRNGNEYKKDPTLKKISTLLSIHNIYQGTFDFANADEMDFDDGKSPLAPIFSDKLIKQNSLKRGVMYADIVNTVSQTYVQELLDAEHGGGLENFYS